MRVLAASILAGVALVGCARDPDTDHCPTMAAGDLAVTEIRGPQTGTDTAGQWVELYNASGGELDLEGLRVRFRKKDGSGELDAIVRRPLPVAAGAYVVLGLDQDDHLPPDVSYGFAGDFHGSAWLSAAAVDVEACGTLVDRAQYDALPRTGTYSLGAKPPTATANDLPVNWCTDANALGTPQQENTACP